jgi:hypothetical protein
MSRCVYSSRRSISGRTRHYRLAEKQLHRKHVLLVRRGLVAYYLAAGSAQKEAVMCYEWFEKRKAKETLEKGKEPADTLIQKIKDAVKLRPAPERNKQPVSDKEKATV